MLALHHSTLVLESATTTRNGYATSTVASESDILHIKAAAKDVFYRASYVDAALPSSTSYLKLVDVPYLHFDKPVVTVHGMHATVLCGSCAVT
jgi:hypothetical protein